MALTANFHLNNPPVGACYGTVNDLFALFRAAASVTLDGSVVGIAKGSTQPSVDDTDKPWLKTTETGHPVAWFSFYNGQWRPVPRADVYDVKYMAITVPDASLFDGTGKGLINTLMDGWALCNGNNGTQNMTDKFVKSNGAQPAGGTGGSPTHTLLAAEIPAHTHLYDKAHVYTGASCQGGGTGFFPVTTPVFDSTASSSFGGTSGVTQAFSTEPAYVVLVPLMYIGY
jgi:hypothetical protein